MRQGLRGKEEVSAQTSLNQERGARMTLPDFKNEADFRENWILPFLRRVGFVNVTHSHGTAEQGKDFFFADIDRFENVKFHACQVKLGNIGAGESELTTLLNQIERCFRVRIREHTTGEETRVSAVYVMASGRISGEARKYICDHCRGVPFGENVHFLDGDRLDQLNRFATYGIEKDRRIRMMGLITEAVTNLKVLDAIEEYANSDNATSNLPQGMLPSNHFAMDHYLATGLLTNPVFMGLVMQAAHACKRVNTHRERWVLPEELRDGFVDRVKEMIIESRDAVKLLHAAASDEVTRLDGLHQVAVDVVEE